MIPRVGEPVQKERSYTIRPGAYAILLRKGQILLTHQSDPKPEIQLPGGGIDPGEHPVPALHREILEETGWRATGLRRMGAFRRFTYMPEYDLWAEKVCHVYIGHPTLCYGAPIEAAHTPVWTTPDQAIRLVENDGDRLFLRQVL